MAEQGRILFQFNLGLMNLQGRGVARDLTKAAYWFRKAARRGNPNAQAQLMSMYFKGQGVPRDLVRAYMWAAIPAALGDQDNLFGVGRLGVDHAESDDRTNNRGFPSDG